MKKQILILVALAFFGYAHAQDVWQSTVPAVILNKFNSDFPNAVDVEWEIQGALYAVEFEIGWNIDHEAWYNATGEMVKHKEEIGTNELPPAVYNKIKTDFEGYTVDDLERITDKGTIMYKMELNALLQQDWEIVMDSTGKVVSKVAD